MEKGLKIKQTCELTDRLNHQRYALFISIPFVGHLNPLLYQAEELVRRGWRVSIASFENIREHIEKHSSIVKFLSLGEAPGTVEVAELFFERITNEPSRMKESFWIMEKLASLWPSMYDALLGEVQLNPPDVMVVDFASGAGIDIAEAMNIPFVVNNADLLPVLPPPLLPHAPEVPQLLSGQSIHTMLPWHKLMSHVSRAFGIALAQIMLGRKYNVLRKSRMLPPVDILRRLKGRTILVNGAFGLEYRRPLPEWIHMVGPMLQNEIPPLSEEWINWLNNGLPVVYVNLGTVSSPSKDQLARLCAGLDSDTFRVLFVLRSPALQRLPSSLPENMKIVDWVPSPLAILRHEQVHVFVSHCGVNSVHESLIAGKPVVAIPMFAAQQDMGMRIKDAGVGVLLNKNNFTGELLLASIMKVMMDKSFRNKISSIQSAFRLAGGVNRAADLIEAEANIQKHRKGNSLRFIDVHATY